MGGDRFNNVVSALFDALPDAGVSALRFDFSSSNLDMAATETIAALDRMTTAPTFLVGYSFGGGVAATIDDARVAGWFLVAPALSMVDPTIGGDPRPKGITAAEHDHFFSPARLEAASADWEATDHATVTGADHMFVGRTDEVTKQCLDWLVRTVGR
jgi:alpha/beta superfamily hydrolase